MTELSVLEDGNYFGEIALLQESPRGATVRALLPTLTLSLERSQFLKLVEENPDVRRAVQDLADKRKLTDVVRRGRTSSALTLFDDLIDGQ